jgi:hypothetical protein
MHPDDTRSLQKSGRGDRIGLFVVGHLDKSFPGNVGDPHVSAYIWQNAWAGTPAI